MEEKYAEGNIPISGLWNIEMVEILAGLQRNALDSAFLAQRVDTSEAETLASLQGNAFDSVALSTQRVDPSEAETLAGLQGNPLDSVFLTQRVDPNYAKTVAGLQENDLGSTAFPTQRDDPSEAETLVDLQRNALDSVCLTQQVDPNETGPRSKAKATAKSLRRKGWKRSSYTEEFLQTMLANIRLSIMTMYHVSKHYGIPRATLQYRLSKKFKNKGKTGPDCVLTAEEEKTIVTWLQTMGRRGFPVTRSALLVKVAAYLRENPRSNPFRNNVPGTRAGQKTVGSEGKVSESRR